jgi:acetyl esterase
VRVGKRPRTAGIGTGYPRLSGPRNRAARPSPPGQTAAYWARYVTDPAQRDEPTASPLRARTEDLVGLPPALVVTAEADVARDEGEQYARNLCTAGVEVSAVRFLGAIHDFVALHALYDSAPTRAALATGSAFLRARMR